ncbi:interleukin-1 receptor type 1-like [Seriola lalandi dorsalis]|uniref:interleukin-1 receptor type 1-like n=1 Tax=Seriola lalandi dorsalis TaxID=1841481 RepID=UPI000C6F4912|nr:interleukin-1 receptor type 1-like [Seriola lalandi dorsalis]
MRTMAVTGWVYLLTVLLYLRFSVAHDHSGETDTYHVSAGHLFLLRCLTADAHTNVTWSRAGMHNLSLPSGVEVRNGSLWFLPVQTSHNGTYTCEKRDETGLSKIIFGVSVSTAECPDTPETISITQDVRGSLPCKQTEIFRLNNTRTIRWMKDCHPVEHILVDDNGNMRLPPVSQKDAGIYTCLVDISLDGRKYTAARSIQLSINSDEFIKPPVMAYPQEEVIVVEVGMRAELKCIAYVGNSEDSETSMYWLVDGNFADDYEGLEESWSYFHTDGKVYGQSILTISKVRRQFLNVPIHCKACNPVGAVSGLMMLREADHSAFYTSVALCLVASFATLALAAAFLFFKVDVVLAYRKLLRHFSKQASDGKLYDGYVSFLHPDTLSSAETASFALQMLPEELEKKHGYSLYIRGRDDCPGDAVHDAIAATLHQCRRLIIILSLAPRSCADGKEVKASPLCDDQNQLCYEQKIGIYDALTKNEPRVILVEIDGPVDYSHLPESLHYIKRKQGALKWKKSPPGTNKLTKLRSNRNFWKNLRYHMPSIPAEKFQTIV